MPCRVRELLICVVLINPAPVQAFDNIEADAAYDRVIKSKIEVEFQQGLKALQAQAAGLGMSVREQDLDKLAHHMYSKAYLMGACTDQGMSIQKAIDPKLQIEKFIPSCVAAHLKFAEEHERRRFAQNNLSSRSRDVFSEHMYDSCMMKSSRLGPAHYNRPYDFLKLGDMATPKDYLLMKRCYESSKL